MSRDITDQSAKSGWRSALLCPPDWLVKLSRRGQSAIFKRNRNNYRGNTWNDSSPNCFPLISVACLNLQLGMIMCKASSTPSAQPFNNRKCRHDAQTPLPHNEIEVVPSLSILWGNKTHESNMFNPGLSGLFAFSNRTRAQTTGCDNLW